MTILRDDREGGTAYPWFCNMTDKVLSGWGVAAKGRSLYSLACASYDEAEVVAENARRRSEMRYVNVSKAPPRLRAGDVATIATKATAPRWYAPNGFSGS